MIGLVHVWVLVAFQVPNAKKNCNDPETRSKSNLRKIIKGLVRAIWHRRYNNKVCVLKDISIEWLHWDK